MSLLGSNGGRTSHPEKNIKEILLQEEIEQLRDIYQGSTQGLQKIMSALKKIMQFDPEKEDKENKEVCLMNNFIDDLSAIEDQLISLSENVEINKDLFARTVIFRDSAKRYQSNFFKKIMASNENFKQLLNSSIQRLEKDIQSLEVNGFHIYDTVIKPNNVLNSLKKHNLDRYLNSVNEMSTIFSKMKNQMVGTINGQKKAIKEVFKNDIQKLKEYHKILSQINLKQKLMCMMLTQEIFKIKGKIVSEVRNIKNIEQSIKINKNKVTLMDAQIKIASNDPNVRQQDFALYLNDIQSKIESLMVAAPTLYRSLKGRSKSCHTIIITNMRLPKLSNKNSISSSKSKQETLISCDFYQSSIQN